MLHWSFLLCLTNDHSLLVMLPLFASMKPLIYLLYAFWYSPFSDYNIMSTSPSEFQYYIDHETLVGNTWWCKKHHVWLQVRLWLPDIVVISHSHLYLGVLFHSMTSFSPHINLITSSAIKSLNFLRRNLTNRDESVKAAGYLGLIRPKLEYASSVWNPHLSKEIHAVERVQQIAARWVKSDYNWENSVTIVCSHNYSGQYYIFKDKYQDCQSYTRVYAI